MSRFASGCCCWYSWCCCCDCRYEKLIDIFAHLLTHTHPHTKRGGSAHTHTHARTHRQRWQLWRRFGYCCYWCAYCYQIIINKSTRNALNHFYCICIYKIYQLPGTLYFRFAFPFPYLVFFVQLRRTSSAAALFLLFYRRVRNIYYWFCTIYIYMQRFA